MTDTAFVVTPKGAKAIADWEARFAAERAREKLAFEKNRAALFAVLALAKIDSIAVEFDGCGDAGAIESVTPYAGGQAVEFPAVRVEIDRASCSEDIQTVSLSLAEAFENLVYDILALKHPGWENNDGAFGELDFDVAAGTIGYTHNQRFTDIDSFDHQI